MVQQQCRSCERTSASSSGAAYNGVPTAEVSEAPKFEVATVELADFVVAVDIRRGSRENDGTCNDARIDSHEISK